MKVIHLLFLSILFSFCSQTSSNSGDEVSKQVTDSTEDDNIKSQVKRNNLDSKEKANSESVVAAREHITKAVVFLKEGDSTINLTADIKRDHRIFGYAEPNVKSERLLLLSVFTNDVESNPFGFKLGAYYDTRNMEGLSLKYLARQGDFIKARATDTANRSTILYFEKKWIEFL